LCSADLNKNDIRVSKFLSYVLRHRPEAIGLNLDSDGWAEIEALIKGSRRAGENIDLALIQKIVAENDKKRYAISEDVHLSADRQTAISVGKRYGAPVILQIDTSAMLEQGLKFYQAENGVWLTKYVSPDFLAVDAP